jgi:hypothetical protein
VAGLSAVVDPSWSQQSSGVQYPDPLMTVEDVTGTITTTIPGQPASARPLSLTLGLGSALHHRGYGAVSASIGGS